MKLHTTTIVFHLSIFVHALKVEQEDPRRPKYRDPRSEFDSTTTTGEQAWLSSQKKGLDASQAQNEVNAIPDNNEAYENGSKITIQNSSMLQSQSPPPQKRREANQQDSSSQLDIPLIQVEFYPFSNPHKLNMTTPIDRPTVARLHNQALDGSVDSAYFLGLIYLYGLNPMTPPDALEAMEWFEKAAMQGHAEAQCGLGLLLYHGIGDVGEDRKTAMRWFYRASVDSKNTRGFWLFGRALYDGTTLTSIGIEAKTTASYLGLNKDYVTSTLFPDLCIAAHLFQKAGDIHEAIHYLALMFEYGLIPSDFPKIHDHHNPRKRKANPSGFYAPNFERAVELYRTAAKLGSIESVYNLGLMYAFGRGLPIDYVRAKDLFRQGSILKHAPSMRYLGLLAREGWGQLGDLPNPAEAIHWLRQCSELKDDRVQELCDQELKELRGFIDAANFALQ